MAEFSTENSYLSTNAWFSRNGPNGQFHNETIAKPLCIIMKRNLILVLLLLSMAVYGQPTIKFIYADTNKPAPHFFGEVFENVHSQVFFWNADRNGYLKIKVLKINPEASYHLSSNNIKYKPVWKKIDINSNDTLTVSVEKNEFYIARSKDLYFSLCSYPFMASHDPREIRNLDDLPDSIFLKVSDYIKKRLGPKLREDFKFINGQIVNLNRLKKVNHRWQSSFSEYKLCFAYRNLKAGINMYASKIELDSSGNVLKDLEFPIVKPNTIQEKIISLNDIKKKVINEGFYNSIDRTFYKNRNNNTEIEMGFDPELNILLWKFKNLTYHPNNTFSDEERVYNAHNGNYITTNYGKGKWIDN